MDVLGTNPLRRGEGGRPDGICCPSGCKDLSNFNFSRSSTIKNEPKARTTLGSSTYAAALGMNLAAVSYSTCSTQTTGSKANTPCFKREASLRNRLELVCLSFTVPAITFKQL